VFEHDTLRNVAAGKKPGTVPDGGDHFDPSHIAVSLTFGPVPTAKQNVSVTQETPYSMLYWEFEYGLAKFGLGTTVHDVPSHISISDDEYKDWEK
jgi:hypothetical protein